MSLLPTTTRRYVSSIVRRRPSGELCARCCQCLARSTLRTGVVEQRAIRLSQRLSSQRSFSSTASSRAALAQHPPANDTVLVSYPSPNALREEHEDSDEPDVDFVPPEEAKLEITDRAAEQLRTMARREKNSDAALRIAVESGGCHGYQYKLELAKKRQDNEYHFTHPTIRPSNVYVDAVSMALLRGSTIDFATELIGSSFRVVDNPQAKGGSCGCGVSWELKI